MSERFADPSEETSDIDVGGLSSSTAKLATLRSGFVYPNCRKCWTNDITTTGCDFITSETNVMEAFSVACFARTMSCSAFSSKVGFRFGAGPQEDGEKRFGVMRDDNDVHVNIECTDACSNGKSLHVRVEQKQLPLNRCDPL